MNALIFGAGGQDGFYLRQLCNELGIASVGISMFPETGCIQGIYPITPKSKGG